MTINTTTGLGYHAEVLADSITEDGHRVFTIEATFPRFILAEVNTHCVLSRNSASSRAIPPEKIIERVLQFPFVPERFSKRTKGMGQGEPLSVPDQRTARDIWLSARSNAVRSAEALLELDVQKSLVNRLLEPFMWHTAIITATEWDNFFALRAPEGDEVDYSFPSQPEFQRIAIMMRQKMRASTPKVLHPGEWHLPLVNEVELEDHIEHGDGFWPMVSAGRCARSSYDLHHEPESVERSHDRAEALERDGHMSPFEHPCRPATKDDKPGKLVGFTSLRQLIPNEENPMRRKWKNK